MDQYLSWLNWLRRTVGLTTSEENLQRQARELAAQGAIPPGEPGSSTRPMGPGGATGAVAPGSGGPSGSTGPARPAAPAPPTGGDYSGNPDASGLPSTTVSVPGVTPPPPSRYGVYGTDEGPPNRRKSDLPFSDPKSELERAKNEQRIREWRLLDARTAQAAVPADASPESKKNADDAVTVAQREVNAQQDQVKQLEASTTTRAPAGTDAGYTEETVAGRRIRRYWKWDGYGNKVPNPDKGDKGLEDVGSALSAVDEQTAQLNLDRARASYEAETDPVVKEQRRVALQQAQFALDQARAKGPVDVATAQLAYDRAKAAYENENDPIAKETRRVALEQAQTALAQAKQTLNKPTESTQDGYLVRVSPSGELTRTDLLTPEQRERADRIAEQNAQPKFAGAQAQLASEATRRQALAEKELQRLEDLQKRGQISPDQAKAQFERWFGMNVEAPLSGYRQAAEEERRKLEQENLTRTTAEQGRVDTLNRERERLAAAAGEAGRQEAITLGQGTRATEYISDLGGLANRLSRGPMGGPGAEAPFQFSAGAFDPANFRKVVPNVNELADAAINRLLARVSPATARDVNVPLPGLPAGPDLRSMMDQVPYSGPLSAAPQAEEPLPGQGAIDLKDLGQPGRARTVYSNSRYVDWDIPPAP
jgi:hypothetical protein